MVNTKSKSFAVIAALCAMLLMIAFGLAACEQGYSVADIQNRLANAGYTVTEGEDLVFPDDSHLKDLAGIQKIFLVTKGTGDDKECAYIVVFDSIGNADKLSDIHLVDIADDAKTKCGDNKKSGYSDITSGRFNNVIFGGYVGIKNAANLS